MKRLIPLVVVMLAGIASAQTSTTLTNGRNYYCWTDNCTTDLLLSPGPGYVWIGYNYDSFGWEMPNSEGVWFGTSCNVSNVAFSNDRQTITLTFSCSNGQSGESIQNQKCVNRSPRYGTCTRWELMGGTTTIN